MVYLVRNIKYKSIVLLLACMLLLASNVSMAQEETDNKAININECIEIAYENNLQLAIARNRLGVTEADRIKASFLLPSNPKVISKVGERDGPDGARTTDYMIRLSQEF